ncbi:MAG TPA: Glu/Leu/Phe/Val dehydrogenase [Kiritimatiellia bacterium]|nr:Glu/Leu/Phe/Val dehydrogenase [Kiritimatiellia bacterium]HRZ11379.1 Glu/Leu/Phe/Val dehydrogenase [Kiritimatiellia bacterium]HSA17070.1 Glu/Leu/Phe/Val dehydrogenase [Kiritimatiellia bacterium]
MNEKVNTFEVAQAQFDEAADRLGLESSLREFLRWPQREYKFTVPVKMDDGSTKTFHGYRIQYNDARGPCSGGLRWHANESLDAGRASAAWMTWRTALVDIPLGGASGGLVCDLRKLTEGERERLARGWMRIMAQPLAEHRDVLTPDLYTNPQIMAWMADEFGSVMGHARPGVVSGKPLALGGILGWSDATARGGVLVVGEACQTLGIDPKGTYAIQGFGNAGQNVALLHPEILGGGRLVAVSDTSGGVINTEGIDPKALVAYKLKTGSVTGFPGAQPVCGEDLLDLDVDVLYPAALENVITRMNAEQIKAKIVCELADGPTAPEADRTLHIKGVHIIPDILASAGSVTVGYFEQVQNASNYTWPLDSVHKQLARIMAHAYRNVLTMHKKQNVPMRLAAYLVAVHRVAEAVKLRGWV